jgi:hypothetical protein
MPRPIELELDLGQHHFEETVSGSDSSDEDDSDDDGSEPTNARCVENDARAAVARRVQLEAVNKARELEPVRVSEELRKAEEARVVEEARLAEKAHRKVSTEGACGGNFSRSANEREEERGTANFKKRESESVSSI